MVDLARFERASLTFAESRSHSAELQVRELAEAAGLEPAHAKRGDLANRCHTVRRRLQLISGGRDRSRTCRRQMRGSFRDYCLTN